MAWMRGHKPQDAPDFSPSVVLALADEVPI
jgi:hypothetical protein